ncbi:putative signal peptide protein [Puccinia sorghi]|uniref:Putative signal peptide protein n=1 Tax=Puccinia sorghi TaxID=27349 RepID=A0A0L6UNX3_9BASI|nr:putative signal peptide protein [Puccinia sorghi]
MFKTPFILYIFSFSLSLIGVGGILSQTCRSLSVFYNQETFMHQTSSSALNKKLLPQKHMLSNQTSILMRNTEPMKAQNFSNQMQSCILNFDFHKEHSGIDKHLFSIYTSNNPSSSTTLPSLKPSTSLLLQFINSLPLFLIYHLQDISKIHSHPASKLSFLSSTEQTPLDPSHVARAVHSYSHFVRQSGWHLTPCVSGLSCYSGPILLCRGPSRASIEVETPVHGGPHFSVTFDMQPIQIKGATPWTSLQYLGWVAPSKPGPQGWVTGSDSNGKFHFCGATAQLQEKGRLESLVRRKIRFCSIGCCFLSSFLLTHILSSSHHHSQFPSLASASHNFPPQLTTCVLVSSAHRARCGNSKGPALQKDIKMGQKQEYYFIFKISAQNNPRSLPYKTPKIPTLLKENSNRTFVEQLEGQNRIFSAHSLQKPGQNSPHLTQQDGKGSQISQHSLTTLTRSNQE